MGFGIAVRAFLAAFFHQDAARRIQLALNGEMEQTPKLAHPETVEASKKDLPKKSLSKGRSEAIELLAALQREARFVDYIKEDVRDCDDATLGAAARIVHDRCAETLERFFEIRPLSDAEEGTLTTVDPASNNPQRIHVTSDVGVASAPVTCRVAHAGWVAKKCASPQWSGKEEDSLILAPVELEID